MTLLPQREFTSSIFCGFSLPDFFFLGSRGCRPKRRLFPLAGPFDSREYALARQPTLSRRPSGSISSVFLLFVLSRNIIRICSMQSPFFLSFFGVFRPVFLLAFTFSFTCSRLAFYEDPLMRARCFFSWSHEFILPSLGFTPLTA